MGHGAAKHALKVKAILPTAIADMYEFPGPHLLRVRVPRSPIISAISQVTYYRLKYIVR
jgi:hypothetical protein